MLVFFFSSRRRHTRSLRDWSSDVCSSDLVVTSLNLQFTYFSTTGVPLRAKVAITLMQYKQSNAFGPQNPTSGTPNPRSEERRVGKECRSRGSPYLIQNNMI